MVFSFDVVLSSPDNKIGYSLRWRHNESDGVSNHQPGDCFLNRLFRRRSEQTSKLRATSLCEGIRRWPVNSPYKGSVTRKMFPFDDVIMQYVFSEHTLLCFIWRWSHFERCALNRQISQIPQWTCPICHNAWYAHFCSRWCIVRYETCALWDL